VLPYTHIEPAVNVCAEGFLTSIEVIVDEEVVFASAGARVIYTVQYFYNQLPLSV
jgi:hypothetical protein